SIINLLDDVTTIIDCGGSIKISADLYVQLGASSGKNQSVVYTSCVQIYDNKLQLSVDASTVYEGYYEIWVEYIKKSF
ncbi:MAG: hypothetical protein LBC76_06085, partial [Treponema sp.]|nr:hypothetical protein [Treponema sp.]